MSALLAAALAVMLALPGAALAYGTSTTYVSAGSATSTSGAWASVGAAASAGDGDASATLTEADAGGIAASAFPSNTGFPDAAGWTATDQNAPLGLCTVTSGQTLADGISPGAIRATFGTALGLLGLVTCTSTWRSDTFTWNAGTPRAVAFSIGRSADLGSVLQLATAQITVTLVDTTAGTGTVLVTENLSSALLGGVGTGWGTLAAAGLTPASIVPGHAYRIEIETRFSSSVALLSGLTATYDDVVLAVTPQDNRATGTLTVSGVPQGSTRTLEVRGRTNGETVDVQVWDGSGWTTRGALTSAGFTTITHGLSAAEVTGGTVQVRVTDSGTGPDATPDVAEIDWVRVVSTGGVSVSGPATVPLSGVVLDGTGPAVATGTLGPVEVLDTGGAASGWDLELTASRWVLDGDPGEMLPVGALEVEPGAPAAPDGDPLTGLAAAGAVVPDPGTPAALLSAAPGGGIGRFTQSSALSLTVPVDALEGTYRSSLVLTVS